MTAVEPVALSRSAAEKLTLDIRQSGARLVTLIQEAHDRKAWAALGYKSWSAYVDVELPFSRATSYRYLSAAPEKDALVAGGELSHGETNNSPNSELVDALDVDQRPLDTITPDAVLPPPAKKSGGAGLQPPPRPTGEADPSLRPAPPDPPEHVDVDAIGLRWLKSKTTREVRAIGDPWGPAIRSEVRRWAEAFGMAPAPAEKPQRRQGTISRPDDRAKAKLMSGPPYNLEVRSVPDRQRHDGTCVCLSCIPPRIGKRHADDCSCLSCKAPKAVAK